MSCHEETRDERDAGHTGGLTPRRAGVVGTQLQSKTVSMTGNPESRGSGGLLGRELRADSVEGGKAECKGGVDYPGNTGPLKDT